MEPEFPEYWMIVRDGTAKAKADLVNHPAHVAIFGLLGEPESLFDSVVKERIDASRKNAHRVTKANSDTCTREFCNSVKLHVLESVLAMSK